MVAVATLACLLVMQQVAEPALSAHPERAWVGEPVLVETRRDAAPATGVAITVVLPDGARESLGATDAAGRLEFAPRVAGQHTLIGEVGGVRCLLPVFVQPERPRWLLAAACVPLGMALLWGQWRLLQRRRVPAAGGPGGTSAP